MAVSAIGGITSSAGTLPANLSVSQQDFLKVLTTQLQFQDPLKPMDNQQFIAQIAQFTTLEQTRQLTASTDNLLAVQATAQAVSLIGKVVEVSAAAGVAQGTVTTITFARGQPTFTVLQANGEILTEVNPASVTLVRNP